MKRNSRTVTNDESALASKVTVSQQIAQRHGSPATRAAIDVANISLNPKPKPPAQPTPPKPQRGIKKVPKSKIRSQPKLKLTPATTATTATTTTAQPSSSFRRNTPTVTIGPFADVTMGQPTGARTSDRGDEKSLAPGPTEMVDLMATPGDDLPPFWGTAQTGMLKTSTGQPMATYLPGGPKAKNFISPDGSVWARTWSKDTFVDSNFVHGYCMMGDPEMGKVPSSAFVQPSGSAYYMAATRKDFGVTPYPAVPVHYSWDSSRLPNLVCEFGEIVGSYGGNLLLHSGINHEFAPTEAPSTTMRVGTILNSRLAQLSNKPILGGYTSPIISKLLITVQPPKADKFQRLRFGVFPGEAFQVGGAPGAQISAIVMSVAKDNKRVSIGNMTLLLSRNLQIPFGQDIDRSTAWC